MKSESSPVWKRGLSFCLPAWSSPTSQHQAKEEEKEESEDKNQGQVHHLGSSDGDSECSSDDEIANAASLPAKESPSQDHASTRKVKSIKTTYYVVRRDECELLRFSWQRLWRQVLLRTITHPSEANALTQFSHRTALHLCTCARKCPLDVAKELIAHNRHALLLCDRQGYTPLHNACALNVKDLVALLCDEAMKVERDMLLLESLDPSTSTKSTRWGKPNRFFAGVHTLPKRRTFQTPLLLAARSGATPEVFRILLDTRHAYGNKRIVGRRVGEWIAPWTGAEPYWDTSVATITMPPLYASPLESLIQERMHLLSLKNIDMDDEKRRRLRSVFLTRFNKSESEGEFVGAVRRRSISTLRNSPHKQSNAIGDSELILVGDDNDIDTAAMFDYSEPIDFEEVVQLWANIMEFFAEYFTTTDDRYDNEATNHIPSQISLLHAVASLTTPNPTLFELVLDVFGAEDATRRDERQMLPLHHAILALQLYNNSIPESSLTDRFVVYRQKQYQLIVSLLLQAPLPSIIHDRRFPNGQTSLVRALEARAPMALLEEILAATNELEIVDARTKLFPFAFAASLDYDLSDIFALLRLSPQVLQE